MKSVFLWVVSVLSLIMALLSVATSLLASAVFLMAGLYLLPPLRAKLIAKQAFLWIFGLVPSTLLTLFFVVTGFVLIGGAQEADFQREILKTYEKNPAAFVSELRGYMASNDYYKIRNRVDPLLRLNPQLNDLIAVRHEAMLAEVKHLSSKDELYRFDLDTRMYSAYKQSSGSATNLEELHSLYLEEAGKSFQNALSNKDPIKAKLQLKRINAILPNSSEAKSFAKELEALEEEIVALEATRSANNSKTSGTSAPSSPSSSNGTVTRIDTTTGNVSISGYSRVTVGKSTSVTVNGSRVKNEGDLLVGDRCTVRMEATDLYARNLICTR